MRTLIFCFVLVVPAAITCRAQQFSATSGYISFYSSAPLEDIYAVNKKVSSLFNSQTSEIALSVPVNQFEFQKKLMQEHFNEKYMESEKFPRATFSGKVQGYNPAVRAAQQVTASGKLSIHGVTRSVEVAGTIALEGDNLVMQSKFTVRLADHNIKIPKIMWQNIAEEVEITVNLTYQPR